MRSFQQIFGLGVAAKVRKMQKKKKLCIFSGIFMLNLMVLQCMTVLFKPIFALHIIKFSSCRNYGGGGQNDMFAPPPKYFHWGAAAPPPPPGSTPQYVHGVGSGGSRSPFDRIISSRCSSYGGSRHWNRSAQYGGKICYKETINKIEIKRIKKSQQSQMLN